MSGVPPIFQRGTSARRWPRPPKCALRHRAQADRWTLIIGPKDQLNYLSRTVCSMAFTTAYKLGQNIRAKASSENRGGVNCIHLLRVTVGSVDTRRWPRGSEAWMGDEDLDAADEEG